ncbi:MAG: YggT family protein [Comamonadaceae bacterium]|nr:YggT family protein [Comamonadaceae bacterium]
MLYEITAFLLEVAVTLVGGACLIRAWMRWQGVSWVGNPVGPLLLALTDWLVKPLARLLPPAGRWDLPCLLAAWLLKLLQYVPLLMLRTGAVWAAWPVMGLLGLLQLAVSVATALVVVAALMSWLQPGAPALRFVHQLTAPLLAPVRRVLPLAGGVDLSPLVVVVALQVLGMMLGNAQARLLMGGW